MRKGKTMKDYQDAFGHALYDYLQNNGGAEIIERSDGYMDVGDIGRYFSEYKDWSPHAKQAMRFVKGRVLDIGCGVGRHSLYLQEKGLDVSGIDVSPLAIEVCQLRGLKKAKVTPITQIDAKMGTFDTLLMLGNNFGLFGNLKRAKWLLKRFHGLTAEKARIIAESNDIYQTTNPIHLAYQEFNRKHGRMSGQIRLRARYKQYATPWFDYLMVSKVEMEGIVQGTGWRVARFIDPPAGSTYIAILEKGE